MKQYSGIFRLHLLLNLWHSSLLQVLCSSLYFMFDIIHKSCGFPVISYKRNFKISARIRNKKFSLECINYFQFKRPSLLNGLYKDLFFTIFFIFQSFFITLARFLVKYLYILALDELDELLMGSIRDAPATGVHGVIL